MRTAAAVVVASLTAMARGQHNLSWTLTVDPSGSADYTTIQAAINAVVPANPAIRQTILIYPGTYTEAVTLGSARDHVDLVGVDRDAVIIRAPADSDAVSIQGNGARNNAIRNLTIVAEDDTAGEGRGVVIKDNGGSAPTDIGIHGVTIRIDGANSDAITLEDRAHQIALSDVLIVGAAESTVYGLRVTGGSAADPSSEISLTEVTMLLDGCSNKAVTFEDEGEDVTFSGLIVRKPAFGGPSVEADLVTNLTLIDCDILAHDGDGLKAGPGTVVRDSSIVVRDAYGSDAGCGSSADDKPAVTIGDIDGVRIDNCYLEGRLAGVNAGSGAADIVITTCDLRGGVKGVGINGASGVSLVNCRIAADSALGEDTTIPVDDHYGVHVLGAASGVSVVSSVVSARSTTARDAIGVYVAAAPTDGPARISDCTVTALVTSAATGVARGALSDAASGVALIGGSATATDGDERETDLYDLYSASTSESRVLVSGTQFSRWKGAMGAAVGQKVEVLRVVDVPSAGAATVLTATPLIGTEKTVTSGISDPAVFRVLSVTSNDPSLNNRSVIVIGRDWADRPIADSIQLNGTATVAGVKPFRSVTKIVLPEKTADNQTVSVGTAEILGLHAPVSDDEDVLQVATKTSAGSAYVIETFTGSPSVERGTVDISSLSPADDDSIEFTYRASK